MIKQILLFRFVLYFMVISLLFYSCEAKDAYFKAKRSTRQTESTLRYVYKDASKIQKALGMENEEISSEDQKKNERKSGLYRTAKYAQQICLFIRFFKS